MHFPTKKIVTLVDRACALVPEFKNMDYQIHMKLFIHGRSLSTYRNYITHLATITIYFEKLPLELKQNEIENYLFYLKQHQKKYSLTYFKHTVYSLRLLFQVYELHHLFVNLPVVIHPRKLPVVLSRMEVIRIMNQPKLFTHRVMIAVLYGCGLRCSEVLNLKTADIDFDRKLLYVEPGKNKRDRLLPMGEILPKMLREYIDFHRPKKWLFHGVMNRLHDTTGRKLSQRALQSAVSMASLNVGIKKHVHVHTLRHTFATHLLEDGVDIGTIQKYMGHVNIRTTLRYIHVAQYEKKINYNLMDHLDGVRKKYAKQISLFEMD